MAAQKQARQIDRNIQKSFMTFDPLTCPGTCDNQLKARNQTYEALISKAASFMWGLFSYALLLALPVVISACKQESPLLTNETLPDVPGIQTKADGGDSVAQFELGSAYAKGLVVTQSYAQAAHWYRLAAGQSNAAALLALGELSEVGQGVQKDEAEAANFYRQAAVLGNPAAQYSLAALYVQGKGVTADDAEALKWYRAAAWQGDALSQYTIGMRYYEGRGVKQDFVEAYQWLSLAASQKISDALPVLDTLKKKMSSEQITQAKGRVTGFTPVKPSASSK